MFRLAFVLRISQAPMYVLSVTSFHHPRVKIHRPRPLARPSFRIRPQQQHLHVSRSKAIDPLHILLHFASQKKQDIYFPIKTARRLWEKEASRQNDLPWPSAEISTVGTKEMESNKNGCIHQDADHGTWQRIEQREGYRARSPIYCWSCWKMMRETRASDGR